MCRPHGRHVFALTSRTWRDVNVHVVHKGRGKPVRVARKRKSEAQRATFIAANTAAKYAPPRRMCSGSRKSSWPVARNLSRGETRREGPSQQLAIAPGGGSGDGRVGTPHHQRVSPTHHSLHDSNTWGQVGKAACGAGVAVGWQGAVGW